MIQGFSAMHAGPPHLQPSHGASSIEQIKDPLIEDLIEAAATQILHPAISSTLLPAGQ